MTEILSYKDRRVIVNGCFSGIGQATARQLLALGAEVHGFDLRRNELNLHSFSPVDLRQPESIDAALATLGGRVDALFNCAGVPPGRPPLEVMNVNFIGTRYLTERVLPQMTHGGAIASIASVAGAGWSHRLATLLQLVATDSAATALKWCEENPEVVAEGYGLSKEAIIVWTMILSSQAIKHGIRVNCTSPGAVQTPMLEEIQHRTPAAAIDAVAELIGRRSQPDEQAWPLLLLNSDAASDINGVNLPVDGGFAAARSTRQQGT